LWDKHQNRSFLILSSLFAGFATFVKLEGTAFLLIYLLIFIILNFSNKAYLIKNKISNLFLFTIPCFSICLAYHLFKIFNSVLKDGVGTTDKTGIFLSLSNFKLFPDVFMSFFNNLFLSGNWNIIWFVLFISFMHLPAKIKNKEVWIILLSLFLFFALYFLTGMFTSNYIWIGGIKSDTTLSRLILHFFPLATLLIVLLNYPEDFKE
jgi:hypothetical protein